MEQLEQIIEIDKQKSISKAAKALYIGQSTLSGSLANLEEELGVGLFERTVSGVVPTEEGKKALLLAQQMLEAAQQLYNLGKENDELYGTVTLLVDLAYGAYLKDIVLTFRKKYPKAELDLRICTPQQMFSYLTDGTYHIALAMFTPEIKERIVRLKRYGVSSESFGFYPFRIFAGKHGKFANKDVITLDELLKEQVFLTSNAVWNVVFPQLPIGDNILTISDRDLLRQLLANDEGVALLPALFAKNVLRSEIDNMKMLEIQCEYNLPMTEALLLYPEKRILTLLEQNLITIVRDTLSD